MSKVTSDFGISEPPAVEVRPQYITEHVCGVLAIACLRRKVITLSREIFGPGKLLESLETVLHEFAHYLQLVRANFNESAAFGPEEEYYKVHCNRRHEREAKEFASKYFKTYEGIWNDIARKHRLEELWRSLVGSREVTHR